jgi:hypothetical protein
MRSNEFDKLNAVKKRKPEQGLAEKEAMLQRQVAMMPPAAPPGTAKVVQPGPNISNQPSTSISDQPKSSTMENNPVQNQTVEEESFMLHGIKVTKDHPLWHHREKNSPLWQKATNWD